MLKEQLESLARSRKKMRLVLTIYPTVSVPLLIGAFIFSWGDGSATFIACLVAFYAAYHFLDGLKFYRWMLHEENRLRRAYALGDKGVKQKGGE